MLRNATIAGLLTFAAVMAAPEFVSRMPDLRMHCVIKGNVNDKGERIFHLPTSAYYGATVIDTARGERWFCSEDEARAAGWRKAKV
jgi:hypothetical protein